MAIGYRTIGAFGDYLCTNIVHVARELELLGCDELAEFLRGAALAIGERFAEDDER
jgi:hypothetical protein